MSGELSSINVRFSVDDSGLKNIGESVSSIGPSITGKMSTLGIAAGTALGQGIVGAVNAAMNQVGQLFNDAIAASDSTQKFSATLDFAGIDKSTITDLQKQTQDYADVTVYDLKTIQNTTAQLAANSVPDYEKLTEAAGNLNAVAGGNADTFSSVAMVLTQTSGAGKLTTENWNQLSNAIPGAAGKVQESLLKSGAYTGNFRDAMAKGEITATEFNKAIMELGNQPVAVEAAKSTETFEGALGNLSATITGELAKALNDLKPFLTELISGLGDLFKWIAENKPLIAGVATAVGVLLVPALWAAVTATAAWTVALLGNPLTWVALAIGALVAGIVWLSTQTTFFTDVWTTLSTAFSDFFNGIGQWAPQAWQNIMDFFNGIGQWFSNLGMQLYSAAANIWGQFVRGALDALMILPSAIADIMSRIPGLDLLGGGLKASINGVKSNVANALGAGTVNNTTNNWNVRAQGLTVGQVQQDSQRRARLAGPIGG